MVGPAAKADACSVHKVNATVILNMHAPSCGIAELDVLWVDLDDSMHAGYKS
jgi:hypothetical protein